MKWDAQTPAFAAAAGHLEVVQVHLSIITYTATIALQHVCNDVTHYVCLQLPTLPFLS